MMDSAVIKLEEYDMKKVKEIAILKGQNPDKLTETEIWGIVSAALLSYKYELLRESKWNKECE